MRVVSLLPSATEILYAIGAGNDVVGVTFECDEPPQARRDARVVSTSALPDGLTPAEISQAVSERMAAGEDIYHLDREALLGLDADVVVTQDLCAVCAVDVSEVNDALDYLGCTARVLTTDPHTLQEVWDSILDIGVATHRVEQAAELVADLRRRVDVVRTAVSERPRPRCLVLEWTDPAFAPGHWVPEMIRAAGGVSALGTPGEKSVGVEWAAVRDSAADVVVVAPCGYTLPDSSRLAGELVATGELDRHVGEAGESGDPVGGTGKSGEQVPVWAVDANASFARPGPRLVDGVEALARILHPELGEPDETMAARIR